MASTLSVLPTTISPKPFTETKPIKDTKALASDLCRHFYSLGWVSGTGGSLSIKVHDESIPKPQQLIVMAPSGVQKERMVAEDMYVVSSNGSVLSGPKFKGYPHKPPKCSDCAPLFMKISHMEMIKGIQGHGYYDELVVPIIENRAHEFELTESLTEAVLLDKSCSQYVGSPLMLRDNLLLALIELVQAVQRSIVHPIEFIEAYPKTTAVLVRNHGVFVWGDSWISAKTQTGPLQVMVHSDMPRESGKMIGNMYGVVKAVLENGNGTLEPVLRCIVLDIEGTTTPISFVTDVLFPYARDNVRKHLTETYDSEETKDDIKLLRAQVDDDLKQGVPGAIPIPPDDAEKEKVIAALVANVESMIRADRKVTALKELQGHIWRTGFQGNELEAVVFDDVVEALKTWHASGIKVYIYSSGSREAQRLIFGNTNFGDLRKYLCGFFDTTIGNKREARSYFEISQSLGVDKPSDILFLTDVVPEAAAAKAAGLKVIISIRPGNAPLPENHGFKTINSFLEI
ncbi:hypothetical protein Syun_008457 [Stephania yunnanensis]|uniref:Class II aldolase/adducin N-terminal domain-containing protein n=1 Tax=Stephania yunnanensis TaxID=152371 RepID=A0AAP0KCN2_9MAGN